MADLELYPVGDVLVDKLVSPTAGQGPVAKGFGAGVAGVKSSLFGAGAAVAGAVGAESLEKAALDKAAAANAEAEKSAQSLEDVDWTDPGSVFGHFKYLLGNAAPSLAAMFAGGLVGRGLGALASRGLTSAAARASALRTGTLAGAVAPDVALEAGQIYPEALTTGVEHPVARAAIGGAAAAALDFVPLLAAERYLKAAGKGGFGAMAKGAIKGAPVGMALEGTQEAGQAVIERLAAGQAMTDEQAISDYINAFAGGAAPGLVFGAGIGAHRGTAAPHAPEPAPAPLPPAEIPTPLPTPLAGPDLEQRAADVALLASIGEPPVAPAPAAVSVPTTSPYNRLEAPVALEANLTTLETLHAQEQDVLQRRTALDEELKLPEGQRRTKSEIVKESRTLDTQIGVVRTQIGQLQAEVDAQVARQATPEGLRAERTGTTEGIALVPALEADTTGAELAVARAKHEAGTLVSMREAKLLRDTEKGAPARPALEVVTEKTPRERFKQETPERRAEVITGVATQSIERHVKELAAAGGFRKGTETAAQNALTSAVQEAAKAPTIEAAEKQIHDAAIRALAGKVNKGDAETFAQSVAKDVAAAPTFYSKGTIAAVTPETLRMLPQITGRFFIINNEGNIHDRNEFGKSVKWVFERRATAEQTARRQGLRVWDKQENRFLVKQQSRGALAQLAVPVRTPVLVNIGLATNDGKGITADEATTALKALGVEVQASTVRPSATEPTLVAQLSRPLSPEEAAALSATLKQEAIAQMTGIEGELYGPGAEQWRPFNPEYFLGLDGRPASAANAAVFEQLDRRNEVLADSGQKLIEHLKGLIGEDPNLEVQIFKAEPGEAIGSFTRTGPLKSVISLALNAKNDLSVADHEGFHYIEEKVLDKREWTIIDRQLRPGADLFNRLLARTRAYDLEHKTTLTDEIISLPQEAHAYGFEFWRRGELKVEGTLAQIFQKIRQFLERIVNYVDGLGFQSIEDIFQAIDQGQYAQRARVEGGQLAFASKADADFKPLVRVVGKDFSKVFYHGTRTRNIRTLIATERPDVSRKQATGNVLLDILVSREQNEFGAELLLSEPRQPQQAVMFSKGQGYGLAVVELKEGTKILDLSDEAARAPVIAIGGGSKVLRFFERPAITDELIAWHMGRVSEGYKQRNPNWEAKIRAAMDPGSPEFAVREWQETLVPYAKAKGWNAIRFADETLLLDRSAIAGVRRATGEEISVAEQTRTYPGSKEASLFTDQPTGAHKEAGVPDTLFSRGAVIDMNRQMAHGELEREQLMNISADAVEQANLSAATFKELFGGLKTEFIGGLKRWRLANLASANYISRYSTGYANVQKTLLAYVQRKNTLIADGVDVRLSEWRTGAAQDDITAVGKALLDRTEKGLLASSPEYAQLMEPLTEKQRRMFDQATGLIADRLQREFEVEQGTMKEVLPEKEYAEWFANRATQVRKLMAEGYVPERRYGDYTVHIYRPATDGQPQLTLHYEQFEHETAAKVQAQRYQEILARESPELKVEAGYRYRAERDTSLSMQQFLDTARRHGINLTQVEKERIAKALIAADSLRRNRLFRRKNVPGYSTDIMRVLAEYAVTMANKVAYSEYSSAMNDALAGRFVDPQVVNGVPQITVDAKRNLWREDGPQAGFYRNLSDELADHVLSPAETGEWSRKLRGFAMLYFLGGSVAAGVVNATSVPINTIPWLSMHTPYTNAFAKTMSAFKMTTKNQGALRDLAILKNRDVAIPDVDAIPGLRNALIQAGEDGTTLDTEIYQIMGLTRGGLLSKSRKVQKAIDAWMFPFRFAEQMNRISTFTSAYRIAGEDGILGANGQIQRLTGRERYKFAQDAVYNTQFRYDEVNRPSLARDPVWAILFTFKSYPLFVVEMLETMYKQNPSSVVIMLLGLSLTGGIQGLPFAEGIMDLVDTVSQRIFGSPFNTRRALRNLAKSASEATVGMDLSEVFLRGVINEMTGMNIGSRVGLGNMIPGTRIGTADNDYARTLQEIVGPVGSMVQAGLEGAGALAKGDFTEALRNSAPLAVRNLVKGAQQFDRGYTEDMKGRKLVDVTGFEAFWQSLGISSANVAKMYELDRIDRQTLAFYTQVRADFTQDIIRALREGDGARAQEVMAAVQAWNTQYPEMPIGFEPSVMRRRIAEAGMPLNERTLRMLPRQLRGTSVALEGTGGGQ